MILIVTVAGDLHAIAIRDALAARNYKECHLFFSDRMATENSLKWQLPYSDGTCLLTLECGRTIDIASIEVIWWRRFAPDQRLDVPAPDERTIALINNDSRGALKGVLQVSFKGVWLSDPNATERAGSKVLQLATAHACGFRIPQTLISQSQADVIEFARRVDGPLIVKPVVGVPGPLMFTQFLHDPAAVLPESYRTAPAIYQEYVPGTRHIRLNCFGDRSFAAVIDSPDLDWRPNLNVPMYTWPVPEAVHVRVRCVLDQLNLRMGVVDLKETPKGELYWFEVNPQGQFLFLEPLTKLSLADHFVDYLLELCEISRPSPATTSRT
ncbi:MAG: RimK family alpha-L-glutamate ligase [Thermoanaerobaculia bacterium]